MIKRFFHWLHVGIIRSRMTAELSRMDDRYLRDIGLHRGNIDAFVRNFVK